MAVLYKVRGDLDKAQTYAIDALEVAHQGNARSVAIAYDTLASIHIDLKHYDIAESFAGESISIFKTLGCHGLLLDSYSTQINALYHLDRTGEALLVYAEAVQGFKERSDF